MKVVYDSEEEYYTFRPKEALPTTPSPNDNTKDFIRPKTNSITKSKAKAEAKSEAKAETKAEAKAKIEAEVKPQPKDNIYFKIKLICKEFNEEIRN